MTEPPPPPHDDPPDGSGGSGLPASAAGAIPTARPILFGLQPRRPTADLVFELDRCRRPWVDVLLLIVLLLDFDIALGLIAYAFIPPGDVPDERWINVVAVLCWAVVSSLIIAFIVLYHRQSSRSVGLTTHQLGTNIALGVPAVMAAFAMHFLCLGIMFLLAPQIFEGANNAENIAKMLPQLHPAVLVGFMIIVATYEELIFRGFLLTRLRAFFGNWPLAVIVSSLLFALPHMTTQEAYLAAPLFMLGVVFSLFTIWRRSIIPAIVAHALFNSIQLLSAQYILKNVAAPAGS